MNNSKLETIKTGCQSRKIYGIQETTILQETFFRLAWKKKKSKMVLKSQFPFPLSNFPNIHTVPRFSITLFPKKLRNAESIPAFDIDALSFQVILIIQ